MALKRSYAAIISRIEVDDVWDSICATMQVGKPFGTMEAWREIQPYHPKWSDATGYDYTSAVLHWALECGVVQRPNQRRWLLPA